MNYLLENITSERIIYRKLEHDDFQDWLPLFQQPDAAKYLGLEHLETPELQCQAWFDKTFNRYENDLGSMNVMICKETGKMVGQCGILIQTIEEKQEIEIGYSILPEFRGKKYAQEAAETCKNFAFENKISNNLVSIIHQENIPSQKVAISNGMYLDKNITYHEQPYQVYRIIKNESNS